MASINNVTVGDQYTDAATLQGLWNNPQGGWFQIAQNPVLFQLQFGERGKSSWGSEQLLGSGAFGSIPSGATGIRFKNSTPGFPAIISATIVVGEEPAVAISALGIITTVSLQDVTQTIITAIGAGTYNLPAGCKAILVECIGGGGGGGGTQSTVGQFGAASAGGGGGAYSAELIVGPASSYPISVGAGGNGGNNGGGGAGGQTSFNNGQVLANGGIGGNVGPSESATIIANGGAGGSVAGAAGTIQMGGNPGGPGIMLDVTGNLPCILGGNGGGAARGGGGGEGAATADNNLSIANNGYAYGGGGSGIGAGNGFGAQTGGSGAQGVIIITEFY